MYSSVLYVSGLSRLYYARIYRMINRIRSLTQPSESIFSSPVPFARGVRAHTYLFQSIFAQRPRRVRARGPRGRRAAGERPEPRGGGLERGAHDSGVPP